MSGEADFVCANIRKLVRYEGYRYSDIAVICAAPAKYRDAVRSAALRYEVPMFVDLPVPVYEKPLQRYLDCLLCAAEDPRGINIIRYIRSGFARIPSDKKEGKTVLITAAVHPGEYVGVETAVELVKMVDNYRKTVYDKR